jgi:HAMP domain-containing protein
MNVLDSPLNGRVLGIRAKMILPLAVFSIVLAATFLSMIRELQARHARAQLLNQSLTIANSVRQWARNAGQPESLQPFVRSLAHGMDDRVIAVTAGEPEIVVAASRPEWIGQAVADVLAADSTAHWLTLASPARRSTSYGQDDDGNVLTVSLPLRIRKSSERSPGWIPGAVVVYSDDCFIRDQQKALTGWFFPGFLAVIAVTALAAELVVNRVVLWPVQKIAAVAQATFKGDRTARVRSTKVDELGQLGKPVRSNVGRSDTA